jgi:hypothetical protein
MDTKQKTKEPIWVTKFVTERDWKEYYSKLSYALVKKVKGGIRVGFIVVDKIPTDCIEAREDELRIIRDYRENSNCFPLPEIISAVPGE